MRNRIQCLSVHQQSSFSLSPHVWPPLLVLCPYPFLLRQSRLLSVSVTCVVFVFYILHMNEVMWFLSFSVWFISLSILPSKFIHVVADGNISSFCDWVAFHCVNLYHIFFIHSSVYVRMAISKKTRNNKCRRGCGGMGTLLTHCWWDRELVQPLGNTVRSFLKKK